MLAYRDLQSSKTFLKVLGMILAVGNVLNASTAKGQADGFDLPVLGKVASVKDNNGKSLLQYICQKI